MGILEKLATWWSARKQERREVETTQAEMRRAGEEEDARTAREIFDEHDLRGG